MLVCVELDDARLAVGVGAGDAEPGGFEPRAGTPD